MCHNTIFVENAINTTRNRLSWAVGTLCEQIEGFFCNGKSMTLATHASIGGI